MQVEKTHPGATTRHDGQTVYFCSDHCRHKYDADPSRYPSGSSSGGAAAEHEPHDHHEFGRGSVAQQAVDPVCGMSVKPATAAAAASYAGRQFYFCGPGCAAKFHADPLTHLAEAPDPVCGMTVPVAGAQWRAEVDGRPYVFCGRGCRDRFVADPAGSLGQSAR